MTYIKINDTLYEASISGRMQDNTWDGRETKQVTAVMDFALMDRLFVDGCTWSIVTENEVPVYQMDENGEYPLDEDGNMIPIGTEVQTDEFDNSDFCIRGDLTKHTNGTCTVNMGKSTDLEDAYELLYGEE